MAFQALAFQALAFQALAGRDEPCLHGGDVRSVQADTITTPTYLHVRFGLANPGQYALMYGGPRPGAASPAATRATAMPFHGKIRRQPMLGGMINQYEAAA